MTQAMSEIAKLIEERTDGRVKCEIYWSQSLAPAKELVSALQSGIADMAIFSPAYEPGKIPLETVGNMPGISADYWAKAMGFWDLINKEPIRSELAQYNIRPLAVFMISAQGLITSEVPVRSLTDMDGLKLAAAGPGADAVKAFGGVPVAMIPPEQYEGIQRGTIDGIVVPLSASVEFGFNEHGKYFTLFDFGSRLYPLGIGEDAWAKISPQDQKIIDDLLPEFIQWTYDAFFKFGDPEAMEIMKGQGIEFIDPSDADKAELMGVLDGLADEWAAEMEAKGMPGKAVLSDFRSLAKKYEAISPYK
jgi:TRAP-type C4-dicarboxylate transport system substrate-binding protein